MGIRRKEIIRGRIKWDREVRLVHQKAQGIENSAMNIQSVGKHHHKLKDSKDRPRKELTMIRLPTTNLLQASEIQIVT